MAAYAYLVSLMTLIDQIHHHPCPPISLHKQHVESLCQDITILQKFLEDYPQDVIIQADVGLESRIAGAAYAVEDVIESYIADRIEPDIVKQIGGSISEGAMTDEQFHQHMQKVTSDMNFVKEEVTQIKEKIPIEDYQLHEQLIPTRLSTSQSARQNSSAVVIFEDALWEVMDKLTGHPSTLQIIPIHGMGGIGKTTLAKIAYENSAITCHFEKRSWVTISQEYNLREILLQFHENNKELSEKSEGELGEKLYKTLFGRRYLVVMDDMWSIEAWNEVKQFFPDENNGSRIMVTTRDLSVAFQLNDSYSFKMNFLDEDRSWNLLCKYVFGEDACPVDELEKIGRRIAKDCKGLPLSIAVIGGLLAKSQWTPDYWEHIDEHLKSFLYLQDEEYCFRILHTSYKSLPMHLKPCFLYLGVFPEDKEIVPSELINMWVAEGFVKPINGKSLEEAAEEYLGDLINRNLIFHKHEFGLMRTGTYCHVHDLVRDVCLIEAEKEKFLFNAILKHNPHVEQGFNPHRRIVVHRSTSAFPPHQVLGVLQSASLVRSLICDFGNDFSEMSLKLCRVLKICNADYNVVSKLPNSRFLHFTWEFELQIASKYQMRLPTWINLFWNIQTLIIDVFWTREKIDIWKMYQLRHVEVRYIPLVTPFREQLSERDYGLVNLQTLSFARNFMCGEEVVMRIPNIKKLEIFMEDESLFHDYHLENLSHLQKLEYLSCQVQGVISRNEILSQSIKFPYSLKTLFLRGIKLHWDDITTRIGSLPLLQELQLHSCGAGPEWNSIEGKFSCLRYLTLLRCVSLREWRAESSHFPRLERLFLGYLRRLTEIPSSIGDIPTLRYIQVFYCIESLHISAEKIKEEQEEFGNDSLHFCIGKIRRD